MRVFLLDLMTLSTINKKEEITDQTYLVTDAEANAIETALKNGCKIKGENGNLIISSVRPSEYYDFNEEKWQWELNQERYDAHTKETRNLLWEAVKKKRETIMVSGAYVKSIGKHFHTDPVSQISYTRAKEYLTLKPDESINWKTMDGSFVLLDSKKLDDVIIGIFEYGQKVYAAAEVHKSKIFSLNLDNGLLEYDINLEWPKLEDER